MQYRFPARSGGLGPSRSIMTSCQHSISVGEEGEVGAVCGAMQKRRHASEDFAHCSTSTDIRFHRQSLRRLASVFPALRRAPINPTRRPKKTHFFHVAYRVACPIGAAGAH